MVFKYKNISYTEQLKENNSKMNTESAIHKLAIKISLAHVKEIENQAKYYSLPIKKINDIPVSVGLVRMGNTKEKYRVMFEIDSAHAHRLTPQDRNHLTLYMCIYQKDESMSLIDFYKEILAKTKEIIKKLKFDRMNGKFVENIEESVEELSMEVFGDCENIELNCDKCACCFNHTKTKTPCGHSVCILCWGKLEIQTNEEDYEMEYQKCPICREEMNF